MSHEKPTSTLSAEMRLTAYAAPTAEIERKEMVAASRFNSAAASPTIRRSPSATPPAASNASAEPARRTAG